MLNPLFLNRYGYSVEDYKDRLRIDLNALQAYLFLSPQLQYKLDLLYLFDGKPEVAECTYYLDDKGTPQLEANRIRPAYTSDAWIYS